MYRSSPYAACGGVRVSEEAGVGKQHLRAWGGVSGGNGR